ncbi:MULTISPECIES: ABC transporter permease [Nitrosomonas]|uniref:Transport permease protein n=1 Tax=Nitrosomonas communis TaxID=44574 RepID=A0A0F7KFV9_9PROT|nr:MULTISPECIES: ABC transporter permease [Nitrosomonas]AKH38053.1 sugar ABC transporter permease [Nitrosomonas communis]TYP81998.1 lipopolysaccharide transport system permease protein [Nitrosomonas communis]UVS59949.1 ABC transporter permease [Nitrosomonas sp. PLL12]
MNPHAARSISPFVLLNTLKTNRGLIYNLIKREVIGRYRGSIMGLLWSFFNPVLMLTVYTFVFSVVFKARWVGGTESKTEFALVLFAGLMLFNLFAECLNRAPNLILGNVNYVKKVVFPLEILPFVAMGSAAFHLLISLFVWLAFYLIFFGIPQATIVLLPVLLIPFFLMTLGLSWFLASLGVYLRDVSQIIGVMMTALMFLSPIFYPIAALPEEYHLFMQISPLTFTVEQARDVMIWGKGLDWGAWAMYMLLAAIIAWFGFAWFQKTRKGFADVL